MHANSRMRTAALFEDALIGGPVRIQRTRTAKTLRESGSPVKVRGQFHQSQRWHCSGCRAETTSSDGSHTQTDF